ncbi:hypothetical protein [Granulicoccus phenolivorans]|uniref:hypothetical protein n=1 Tax=Granulicoccus phenolivorans TaxID=266854 RepID=UPI0003F9F366|nr:hypothetical protein [Granulicoccus phenolivorans]
MQHDTRVQDVTEAIAALRAADDALAVVDAARRVREAAEALEEDAIRSARADGASWSKIGAKYGLTKQGAQQRFAKRGLDARKKSGPDPSAVTEG